jgi:hypothetical protein
VIRTPDERFATLSDGLRQHSVDEEPPDADAQEGGP